MAEFLAKNGGKWESPVEQTDSVKFISVVGFGLYFNFDENKNILRMRNLSHFRQSSFPEYERNWYWDAVKKEIQMITWLSGGTLEKGIIEVVSEKAFVATYERIDENGNSSKWREENVITSEREFSTTIYKEADENWVAEVNYVWKR